MPPTLEARLERLERSARRWRAAAVVAACGLVALLAGGADRHAPDVMNVGRVVRATGFELWDANAKRVDLDLVAAIRQIQTQAAVPAQPAPAPTAAPNVTRLREVVTQYNAIGDAIASVRARLTSDRVEREQNAAQIRQLELQQVALRGEIHTLASSLPPQYAVVTNYLTSFSGTYPTHLQAHTADPAAASMLRSVGLMK
jgi:hypothetical protein